jgi:hypothetical protein
MGENDGPHLRHSNQDYFYGQHTQSGETLTTATGVIEVRCNPIDLFRCNLGLSATAHGSISSSDDDETAAMRDLPSLPWG